MEAIMYSMLAPDFSFEPQRHKDTKKTFYRFLLLSFSFCLLSFVSYFDKIADTAVKR